MAIVDFAFHPGATTVHVGDTVTWTNSGKQPHTATANNGSFNTGILQTGQSGSHTFTQAGTFSYVCSFHPFMHGTVVVTGGASAPTSASHGSAASQSQTAATPTTATGAAPAGSSLPMTGLDIAPVVAAGGLLLLSGSVLRRRLR